MDYDSRTDTLLLTDDSESTSTQPISICLVLGYRCDMNCYYCLNPEGDRRDFLTVSPSLLKLLSTWAPMRVVMTGGEPTLYPALMSSVGEALKRMGHSVIVSTHGLHFQHLLLNEWIDRVNVSIPGLSRTTYEAVRGIDGLRTVVQGVHTLVKAGKQVTMNFTVVHDNLSEVPAAVKFAEDLGATVLGYEVVFEIGRARRAKVALSRQELAYAFAKVPESRNVKILFPSVGKIFELVKSGLIVAELSGDIYTFSTEPEHLINTADQVLAQQGITLSSHLEANRQLHALSAEEGKTEFWTWCRQMSS